MLAALYTGSHAHKYGTEISETNDSSHLHGHNCLWKIILQFEIYWHYLLVSAFFALYSMSSYTKRWQDGEKGKHPARFIRLSDVLIGSCFFQQNLFRRRAFTWKCFHHQMTSVAVFLPDSSSPSEFQPKTAMLNIACLTRNLTYFSHELILLRNEAVCINMFLYLPKGNEFQFYGDSHEIYFKK